jgi:quercetin dioxygenase-like cupin family protein
MTLNRSIRCPRITKYVGAVVCTAVLGGSLLYLSPAVAQQAPLEFIPLAFGRSMEHQIKLQQKGPADILQAKIVVQPGGDTGWHTHPGPVVVVVAKGSLTEYHANGCISYHPTGSVFFEEPGEVHKVINHDPSVAGEAYATFILPAGGQPLEPAPAPAVGVCRN